MGGPSNEHEVSLATAKSVYKFIDRKKYTPYLLLLTRDKKLFLNKKWLPFPRGLKQFDVVFNALHGTFGEDGELQKIMNRENIKYTGSGVHASKIGMDKWQSRKLFLGAGISVPKSKILRRVPKAINMPFPLFVKPRNGGSSVDTSKIRSIDELRNKTRTILRNDDAVIEEYLPGREFTVGILERKGKPFALPVVEIVPKAKYDFFDYEAKYKTGASREIVPARINRATAKKLRRAALRAHKAIGACAYSRSDFILNNGECYILEINTLPGLTKNSLIPRAAKAAGILFPKLIDTIVHRTS